MVFGWREAGAATLTLVTHEVDDEVLAEGVRFRVTWEPGGG